MSDPIRRPILTRQDVLRGIGVAGGAVAARGLLGGGRAAGQEEVTLRVWDNWTRDVDSQVIETLNEEFQESHPGVTIERVAKSFDDLKATARLALSSAEGPDVAQINQGLSDMGAMVRANALLDLTPYAQRFGWFDKISPGVVARNSFSPDGRLFGEGVLFGMPVTAEFVGVFYNREKLAALGGEVPVTFADLEALFQQFLDAGEIPIAFGNLEGTPAIHPYSEIQNLYVDMAYLDNFVYGRNNVSFATPENERAAAKLQEWAQKGYFTPDYSGIGYDDSWQAFKGGQGATMITGSWISGQLIADLPAEQFGFFLFPPETAGATKPSVAGTSMAYSIRRDSANADLAAEYIDLMSSDRAAELWLQAQVVPIRAEAAQTQPGTLFADLAASWTRLNETNMVGHYIDWATPTFFDTLTAALQELLAEAMTPQEFVQRCQEDYAAYLAEKGS